MSIKMLTMVWDTEVATSTMKIVLLSLADHHNQKTNLCFPSMKRIAKKTGLNRETVWRNIKKLEDTGLISIHRNAGDGLSARLNRYSLHLGECDRNSQTLCDGNSQTHCDFETEGSGFGSGDSNSESEDSDSPSTEPLLTLNKPLSNPARNTSYKPENQEPEQKKSREADQEIKTQFNLVMSLYPERDGSNSEQSAFKEWNARINEGKTANEMKGGVGRYSAWCDANKKTGTNWVMQACRFFGPDMEFSKLWKIRKPENRATLPKDDNQLQAWAIENELGIAPVGMTNPQYRQHLEMKIREGTGATASLG